jgi:hypothetical protein
MTSSQAWLLFSTIPLAVLCTPTVTIAGPPQVVWAAVDTYHKCKIIDVPDIPLRAFFEQPNGPIHAVVGSTNYHRMAGNSLTNLTRECAVAWNETGDPNPAMFSGDEFLDSTYAFPNGTVYSLIHTEYPGNVYGNCTGPAYPRCWTVTIGLAVSYDYGSTWAHARPPPYHLVAAVPYGYNQSQLAYGWGDPSNMVLKADGYFYVALWNRNQVGLQAPGVCIARTNDLTDPSSWRGLGAGGSYNVSFASPYTLPPGTEGEHVCSVVNLPNCPLGGLVYSSYLATYVATLDCSLQSGAHFYIAYSDDLIHWSTPETLYQMSDLPQNVSAQVTSMSYPAFLDPTAPANGDYNFLTIGQNPWLSWVSIGHSPYSDGRHAWVTPMAFSK